jgi:ribosomal protein S12 methylthiotransferase
MNRKKISLISLGCPKALVDSERIITQLKKLGYDIISDHKKAELVIINTCGFINEAIEESLNAIGAALQENGKVIITGCLGAKKEIILAKYPQVLNITGPNSCDEIIKIVQQHLPISQTNNYFIPTHGIKLTPAHYAYVKISEGCNQHCTYCIIPQLRGKLVSRPINKIILETEELVAAGVKELIIISQDTGAYGTDLKNTNFLKLATALSKLNIWIRLHYLYPYPDIDQIIPLMAEKKIVPYLDIPFQHINSRILKLMRRPAKSKNILQRIQKWRKICPDITIRSTFIVGFPGETAAEFNELLEFLKKAQLDRVGCFKYSSVPGAKANEFPNQIPEQIKQQRFYELMSLQQEISAKKLATKIGTTIPVLIDNVQNSQAIGRSYADAPDIDGQVVINNASHLKPGDLVDATIKKASEYDLFADF